MNKQRMENQKETRQELYERLCQYAASDFYPWHMPGHKRHLVEFGDPFSIDITEIDGFDDLHHPDGILKEAMEEAAQIYGSEKTYFLVNGSSCGILAAVCAAVSSGGKLLMARNCHKSAYHGALLQQAQVTYIYPKLEKEGFYGVLQAKDVELALEADPDIRALILVSPGYEGVVSDIAAISEAAHAHGCTVIVDEAHGAHLPFGSASAELDFPESALKKGADVVIQSLHKTLPSLTQTALLHLGKGSSRWISREQIELYLRIYQSSSPSYVFMASIDHCIRLMAGEQGKRLMKEYGKNLSAVRRCLKEKLQVLKLYEPDGNMDGACFYDPSKLVITAGTGGAVRLADVLRRDYHLEVEMNTDRYVILMTSPADTPESFKRLVDALLEIDSRADFREGICNTPALQAELPVRAPETVVKSAFACASSGKWVPFSEAAGTVCHDFIYIYPPGIPLLVPGERIEVQHLELIRTWREHGLEVHGIRDGCHLIRIMI